MSKLNMKLISLLLALSMLVCTFSCMVYAEDSSAYIEILEPSVIDSTSSPLVEITPNPDYDLNASMIGIQSISEGSVISNGVYRLKNAYNEKYMDTNSGGTTSGTSIVQWDYSPYINGNVNVPNRNQLFKITHVYTTSGGKEFYTIRPMTNSGMGVETALSGTNSNATIESISTTDEWSDLLYNHLWIISLDNNDYYTLKNGGVGTNSYLSVPFNTTNGANVYTSSSLGINSKWILEDYSESDLEGVVMPNYRDKIICGERYDFDACMYSYVPGINGPISFRVGNEQFGSTNLASIDTNTGEFKATGIGVVKIGVTYTNAPWVWWWTIEIDQAGCRTYFNISAGSLLSRAANCQGYAFATNDNPQDWYGNASSMASVFTTSNDYLYGNELRDGFKTLLEDNYLDNAFANKWEEAFSDNDGWDIELNDDQWLVVFRVGAHGGQNFDYHFWYRTNTGEWANKHGFWGTGSEQLGDDVPTDDHSVGWKCGTTSYYYDSDIIYYVITQ